MRHIIVCSLKTGKNPGRSYYDYLKKKKEPLDYIPVSLISIVFMLCEKVIKKQWMEYLERE